MYIVNNWSQAVCFTSIPFLTYIFVLMLHYLRSTFLSFNILYDNIIRIIFIYPSVGSKWLASDNIWQTLNQSVCAEYDISSNRAEQFKKILTFVKVDQSWSLTSHSKSQGLYYIGISSQHLPLAALEPTQR